MINGDRVEGDTSVCTTTMTRTRTRTKSRSQRTNQPPHVKITIQHVLCFTMETMLADVIFVRDLLLATDTVYSMGHRVGRLISGLGLLFDGLDMGAVS